MPKRPPSESHHGSSRSAKRTASSSSSHGSSGTGSMEERPYSSDRHGSSGRMEEGTPSCRHRSRRTDKRPSSSGRHGSGRTANKHERPAPATRWRQRRKKYLYLVMDDWEKGYGIYRVDVDSFDPDAEFDSDSEAECQGRPRDDELSPLVRVEAPISFSRWVTAHGSKIFMMLPVPVDAIPGIPVFDTVTRAMMVSPWPENFGKEMQPFYVSVGDRLVRLCNPGFQVLGAQPPPRSGDGYVDVPWAWEEISDDNALSMPPFTSNRVSAYAVHPDGRTIWVSVSNWKPVVDDRGGSYGDRNSTFSFDTENLEWAHVGEWLMPFEGQAHYVGELDAWVGLSRVDKGYLCCCPNDGYGPWGEGPFTSRIGSEMMFRPDKYGGRVAKLLYMGKSRFCMVESKVHNFPADQCKCKFHGDKAEAEGRIRAIRMTTFRVEYNRGGEPCVAGRRSRATRFFKDAHSTVNLDLAPVAFWI